MLKVRAAIIHITPVLFDLNIPTLHVFLNKKQVLPFTEIFDSRHFRRRTFCCTVSSRRSRKTVRYRRYQQPLRRVQAVSIM
jgi:hypothetical protein